MPKDRPGGWRRSLHASSGAPSPPSPQTLTARRWNQASVTVGHLAGHYGFTDLDGSRPDAWGYMRDSEPDPHVDPADHR